MDKLKELLTSRKFWAALLGLLIIIARAVDPNFPLDESQVTPLVTLLAAYIVGVAVERPAGQA